MKTSKLQLTGKVALITGAGRGIGRAIAIGFAGAGASVVCVSRTTSEIDATAASINSQGGTSMAIKADVTSNRAVVEMYQTAISKFGGLDILVINAGGNMDRATVEDSNPEDWQATIDLNLTGAYLCAHHAIAAMRARGGGKIITLGSGLGHKGKSGGAAYACSKAGLWMLTRVLAQELWKDNISVNELIPGPVETSLTADAVRLKQGVFGETSEWIKQPEDVVPMALFLASQESVGPSAQSFSLMRRDT